MIPEKPQENSWGFGATALRQGRFALDAAGDQVQFALRRAEVSSPNSHAGRMLILRRICRPASRRAIAPSAFDGFSIASSRSPPCAPPA